MKGPQAPATKLKECSDLGYINYHKFAATEKNDRAHTTTVNQTMQLIEVSNVFGATGRPPKP
jgi:hypothetical protein